MEKTIRRKTTDGLIWNTLQKLASKGLQLVFSILIARILVPEDYGLIAIANLFIALSDVLIDSGFSKALIRQNDKTEADYSTVFWFNLLASCTLYALLFAVAPLIAGYYQAEALAPIIRAISLSLIINAICGVQSLHMMVEMDFRSLAIMETSAMAIGGITALVLAMHGAGVWALVAQTLVGCTARTILIWLKGRFRPVRAFSGAILSREGKIRFAKEPAPVLFFHGMSDGIVNYKKTVFFKNRFEGAASLSKLFAKKEYNYNIHRFEGKNHEIAVSFLATFPEQLRFLEENVIRGKRRIVDAVINDPSIKAWKLNSTKDIYKNN